MTEPILLEVRDLRVHFRPRHGLRRGAAQVVRAVDGVSLALHEGETLGVVGESGCGKSTMARAILRLVDTTDGHVFLRGRDLLALRGEELRHARGDIQMVFQDPYASLDPRMTVGQAVTEPLRAHGTGGGPPPLVRAEELLATVGLDARWLQQRPAAMSGGQRQRVGIARALALRPAVIICDEPVSALDVSVQAEVLNLLQALKKDFHLSYMFISHDLSVVRHVSDRVAVMYLGHIVESAPAAQLYAAPRHPYTQALLRAVPRMDEASRKTFATVSGEVANPANPPTGCPFHPRCPVATSVCRETFPKTRAVGPAHHVACHLVEPDD